ncbi:MAG: hypothetical protein GTO63_30060 [Anaerolineae bacterium]|nr:hypothetical protein [Anaerolineae bacterium]NIN98951.1 hypothetical protein [Anaerolineae bacterium]
MGKIVAVDFDGVLHDYSSGWRGVDVIPDGEVPGAIGWLRKLIEDPEILVKIFSTRNHQPGAIGAMQNWLLDHGLPSDQTIELDFPLTKPPAHVLIDDRAMTFNGTFPRLDQIKNFQPWHKRGVFPGA